MKKRSSRSLPLNCWLLAAGLASLLVAGLAWACEEAEQTAATTTPTAETTDTVAGEPEAETPPTAVPQGSALRVFIDPQTGEPVVPPPAKRRESPIVVDPLQFSDHGLERIMRPDGSSLVRLEGRFQNMLVLQVGEDGQMTVGHQPAQQVGSEDGEEASHDE